MSSVSVPPRLEAIAQEAVASSADEASKLAFLQRRAAGIQKHLCSINFIDLWQHSRPPMAKEGDGGFDREAMLKAALAEVGSHLELTKDLTIMVKHFVHSYLDQRYDQLLAAQVEKVKKRYVGVWGVNDPARVLNSSHVAMTFPYETAIRISKILTKKTPPSPSADEASTRIDATLRGTLGGLHPFLAFPFGLMIIPSAWTHTIGLWKAWFHTYCGENVGLRVQMSLRGRIDGQIAAMESLAASDKKLNLTRMKCFGIVDETYVFSASGGKVFFNSTDKI